MLRRGDGPLVHVGDVMEIKDIQVKDLTAIKIAGKIMNGLVSIATLAAVCWIGFNKMNGLLWFPIAIGFIATLNLG